MYHVKSTEVSGAGRGVTVTYSSQQTLGLLDGAVTAKEANHHHDGTKTDHDVDTWMYTQRLNITGNFIGDFFL